MFARTERLLLRPSWPEDAQELHAAIADEGIVRNLARAPWPYTADDAVHFTAQAHDERHPAFLLMLRTKGAPRLVGGCGIGDLDGEAELGYWIARPYWGLGFATEASRAVINIAKAIGHNKLIASHFTDNPASGNVLRFKTDGDLPPALAQRARITGRIVQFPARDALDIETYLGAVRQAGLLAQRRVASIGRHHQGRRQRLAIRQAHPHHPLTLPQQPRDRHAGTPLQRRQPPPLGDHRLEAIGGEQSVEIELLLCSGFCFFVCDVGKFSVGAFPYDLGDVRTDLFLDLINRAVGIFENVVQECSRYLLWCSTVF
mgnify:CR=1 FL=1